MVAGLPAQYYRAQFLVRHFTMPGTPPEFRTPQDMGSVMYKRRSGCGSLWSVLLLTGSLLSGQAQAVTVNFSGFLDLIDRDDGGAVFSGVPLGTAFTGFIVDSPISGSITAMLPPAGPAGDITAAFGCCIAADPAPVLSNNTALDSTTAGILNAVTGTGNFSVGDIFDFVDIEGDAMTAGNGRIEIGLSYLLDQNTYSGSSVPTFPLDPNDIVLALFFIIEEDSGGTEIYNALGVLQPVPVPAAFWLFGSGLLALGGMARRRRLRL